MGEWIVSLDPLLVYEWGGFQGRGIRKWCAGPWASPGRFCFWFRRSAAVGPTAAFPAHCQDRVARPPALSTALIRGAWAPPFLFCRGWWCPPWKPPFLFISWFAGWAVSSGGKRLPLHSLWYCVSFGEKRSKRGGGTRKPSDEFQNEKSRDR